MQLHVPYVVCIYEEHMSKLLRDGVLPYLQCNIVLSNTTENYRVLVQFL